MNENDSNLEEDSYVSCPTCMGTFSNCLRCKDLGLISAEDLSPEEIRYVSKHRDTMVYWHGGGAIYLDETTKGFDNSS